MTLVENMDAAGLFNPRFEFRDIVLECSSRVRAEALTRFFDPDASDSTGVAAVLVAGVLYVRVETPEEPSSNREVSDSDNVAALLEGIEISIDIGLIS